VDHNGVFAADRLIRVAAHWTLNLVLVVLGYRLAYELRFDFAVPAAQSELFWSSLPLLLVLRFGSYANYGVFRAHWLRFGAYDLLRLALAVTLSSLGFVAVLYMSRLSPGVPGTVLIIEWASAIFLAGGIPLIVRALREAPAPVVTPRGRRALIIGTGEHAGQVLREARRAGNCALNPVGLIGLDGSLRDSTLHGVSVVGTVDELTAICARLKTDFALVALESRELGEMKRVVDRCVAGRLQFKIVPSVHEVLESTTGSPPLRDVQLEAPSGRPAVDLDLGPVAADLQSRVILVTGAAGSIGSELARQIAPLGPARLVLLDQAESDLYFLHLELSQAHPALDLAPVICDITNASRLAQVFAQHRPDYVVHAAAYKHVPMMEANVFEAVRNNVLGTLLVATTAVRYGAAKVLLVSTDKASRPSSVMGATKRIAERIVFGLPNLHRSGTDFRAVRFGDVPASQGSVIHFMAISEAAQLVLQAGSLPESGGAITMLDMGEQEQSSPVEATVATSSPKIRITQTAESAGPDLVEALSRLFAWLDGGDRDGLLRTLCELVPECVEPLAQHHRVSDVRLEPHCSRRDSGAWQTLLSTNQSPSRERRRTGVRPVPLGLHAEERREGLECRRKEARAGGRRRTDVTATSTADRLGAARREMVS
jgi:FlaA1/EpsC-like NDP-sugar epimerase